MTDLSKIALALSLAEDADEAKILSAVQALNERPDPEPVKLDEAAKAEGKVLLDAGQVAELEANAARGVEAANKLHERDFDDAYTKALSEGRVDAKPETRERFRKLYDVDADTTVATLADLPQVVNVTAQGDGGDAGEVPDGYDADRYRLDARAKAIMAEKSIPYTEALNLAVSELEAVSA